MRPTAPILLALLALSLPPAPAAAAPPPATTVTITMVKHAFAPALLHLRAGQRYRLVLANRSGTTHDLHAPAFFAAARLEPADMGMIRGDRLDVPKYSRRILWITPARGRYEYRSTKALDLPFAMKGRITVR